MANVGDACGKVEAKMEALVKERLGGLGDFIFNELANWNRAARAYRAVLLQIAEETCGKKRRWQCFDALMEAVNVDFHVETRITIDKDIIREWLGEEVCNDG